MKRKSRVLFKLCVRALLHEMVPGAARAAEEPVLLIHKHPDMVVLRQRARTVLAEADPHRWTKPTSLILSPRHYRHA
jgi:hypothetical protein